MTKIVAIVLAVFSALASAYLWTQVLPSYKQQIDENVIYVHTIDVGEFSISGGGSSLIQHYTIRVYNRDKTAITNLSQIKDKNIYYCDFAASSSGAVSISNAYVNINAGRCIIVHSGGRYSGTISDIYDTVKRF